MSPDSAVAWWAMVGAVGDRKVFANRDFYWDRMRQEINDSSNNNIPRRGGA